MYLSVNGAHSALGGPGHWPLMLCFELAKNIIVERQELPLRHSTEVVFALLEISSPGLNSQRSH